MADDGTSTSCSRRSLLNGGAALVAGGLLGSAPAAAAKQPPGATAELPWRWAKVDPMEAGSRAFRRYHDAGG